jgi:hypothetical protein
VSVCEEQEFAGLPSAFWFATVMPTAMATRRVSPAIVQDLGLADVADLDIPVGVHEHVVGVHVEVRDAVGVYVCELLEAPRPQPQRGPAPGCRARRVC